MGHQARVKRARQTVMRVVARQAARANALPVPRGPHDQAPARDAWRTFYALVRCGRLRPMRGKVDPTGAGR